MGAGVLFIQSRPIDNTELKRGVDLLQLLQGLDSQWSVEVLQVSTNPQADFDGLAAIAPDVRTKSESLRDIARGDPGIPAGLKAGLMSYVSRLDSKEERIERFKSAYAIVRNSQRYLPLALQLVTAETSELNQTDLRQAIETQHADIENYLANPSAIEKQRILLGIETLRTLRAQYPASAGTALSNFLAHALVLLEQKAPLDELRIEATSLDGVNASAKLGTELSALIELRDEERGAQQRLSFGIVFAVLIGLAAFFALTRRAQTTTVAAGPDLAGEAVLDLSSTELNLYDELPRAGRDSAPTGHYPIDGVTKIYLEYLAQVVRASGRQLGSHLLLMKEAYVDIARGLKESESSLQAGDGPAVEKALLQAKTKLHAVNEILRVKTVPKLLQAMNASTRSVDRASQEFHALMRPIIETQKKPVDLVECVENALVLALGDDSNVRVERELPQVTLIEGSAGEITAAFQCIVANSAEEFTRSGQSGVLRIQTAEGTGSVSVTFTDNGGGMDEQTRKTATTAFASSKEDHRGLGLSAALYIVKKHGGSVQINSVTGKGTAVRILLPNGAKATV